MVMQVAQDLGYDLGKLRRNKIQRIAFLLHAQPHLSPVYTTVLRGAEEACRRKGIALSFVVASPTDSVVEQLHLHECDAILCVGFFEPDLLTSLRAVGKPIVLVDMKMPGYSSVNPDNVAGGYRATRHLLGLGRARIGMISGSLGRPGIRERHRGYRQALFDAGMLADPRYEISIDEGLDLETGVQEAMQTLLDLPHPPDAVFCYSDAAALVAMRTCVAAGLHVPHDVSIVGFDDIPEAMLGHRPLTTFRNDMTDLGAAGVELLLDGVHDEPVEKVLPVELVVRASTVGDACPKRRGRPAT
jgi:DNA-binding LacI/PurR family transcriptional regulator